MVKNTEIDIQKLNKLELIASVVESADNSIIILDKDGAILWANKAFELIHGKHSKDSFQNESSDYVRILNETDKNFFKKNNSFSFSRKLNTKKGQIKWIQSTLTPVKDKNSKVKQFIVIETDITQQKEVEEELVQQWENTQTVAEHLESVKDFVEKQIEELVQQKKALEIAKEKSEEVLKKVLPYEVAIQLKKKGYATPRHYKKVTLLNLNIRNFFKLTDTIAIDDLVRQLHESLIKFDNILENHYVEKIKTAGGVYLGAGGVPLRNRSNPIDVVLSAIEIRNDLKQINHVRNKEKLPVFETAIGIHTGKVIAGVVGKNKLTYDIWGDTVNIASTIENQIPEGKIFVSQTTYQEVSEYFDIEQGEKLILESAEEINLFEIKKIKNKYARDKDGIVPNQEFLHILSAL